MSRSFNVDDLIRSYDSDEKNKGRRYREFLYHCYTKFEKEIKRRVIQNLYNAASSIGVFKGLNKEERDIIGSAGLNQTTNALRADFVGGIHVKIF